MKKLILIFLFTLFFLIPNLVQAGCPTNEFILSQLTPLTFSFEKRDGTGEDTTNINNKRVAISYWNGSAVRWYTGTDWTSATEQLLSMTQVTGSQYRYNFTPNSTVSGQFIMIRFSEVDNVDVTSSCLAFVHPESRWVSSSGVTVTTNNDKTGYSLSTAGVDAVLDDPVEGSYTMRQILCVLAGWTVGKASGGGTTTITFRNVGDTLNRIVETTDSNGNRSAITLTLTGCP